MEESPELAEKEPDKPVVEDVIPEEWKFLMNDVIPEKVDDIWPDDIPEDVRAFHLSLSEDIKQHIHEEGDVGDELDDILEDVKAFHLSLSKNFKELDIIPEEVNDVLSDDIPEDVKAFHLSLSKNFKELDIISEEVKELDIIPEEALDVIPEEKDDLVALTTELMSTGNEDDYKLEIDNKVEDVGQLSERIEEIKKSIVQLRSGILSSGGGEVRLEFLDDIDRDSAKTDGMYLKYQAAAKKWIGSVSTETGFDPSGYEYTNDSSLYLIENDTDDNGLVIEEGEWAKLPCSGYTTNNLPTGTHSGIAGTVAFTGSGSTTYSRIWNSTTSRFYFDEMDQKTVLMFRLKVDMIPETNNTLVQARINFYAMRDGTDNPLLETSTTEPLQVDKILLEDSSGYITGDTFLAYNFQQTVAAQELADGAGVEHERSFVFPIYVGDASSQRGFGEFEIYTTAEMVVTDTSILGALN
jgi:hypothetical protein